MPHLRSEEKRVQRRIWRKVREYLYEQDLTERQYAQRIISDFSFKDLTNRDVVYTESFENIVIDKLEIAFPDGWKHVVTYKAGDVLNRFPLKPFPTHTYLDK